MNFWKRGSFAYGIQRRGYPETRLLRVWDTAFGESTRDTGMNKRTEGAKYEALARIYLEEKGYRILACNFRCLRSEVDLIAREGKYLVFVEVKERSSDALGFGAESVDRRKQERIIAAARYYMHLIRMDPETPVRFDVVSIDRGRIRLIRNAFLYKG